MNRDEIIGKVLSVIDELGSNISMNMAVNYPISMLLDQAGREVLMVAPIAAINRKKSFRDSHTTAKEDGTGEVTLPNDFVRLISFKMRWWHRSVNEAISTTSSKYARQFHRATRGGMASPVVVICSDKIQYFSVPLDSEHLIEIADYIDFIEVDEKYPSKLLDALVWLTASMSLKVMSEYDASKMAMDEYERFIKNLYLNYGK